MEEAMAGGGGSDEGGGFRRTAAERQLWCFADRSASYRFEAREALECSREGTNSEEAPCLAWFTDMLVERRESLGLDGNGFGLRRYAPG